MPLSTCRSAPSNSHGMSRVSTLCTPSPALSSLSYPQCQCRSGRQNRRNIQSEDTRPHTMVHSLWCHPVFCSVSCSVITVFNPSARHRVHRSIVESLRILEGCCHQTTHSPLRHLHAEVQIIPVPVEYLLILFSPIQHSFGQQEQV